MMNSQVAESPREFPHDENLVNGSEKDVLTQALKTNIKEALLEKFHAGDERPCESSDFSETKINREKITSTIKSLTEDFMKCKIREDTKTINLDIDNELLSLILILHGQNVTLHPWNTAVIVKNCEIILSTVLKFLNFKDVPELLSRNGKINLIKDVLQILSVDLTASEWKHFPASVVCYKWILEMIEEPELSRHLNYVLPPALLLTDDFVKENTIVGVQCLDHIAKNITILELQLCGYGDVIFSALKPLLRLKDADIIHSAINALVSVTTKLEYDLGKKDPTKWSKFDTVLEIFLENMELEQRIDLRNCYISNLTLMISVTGFGIIRWSKRLLSIFNEYMKTAREYTDEKTVHKTLQAIENYLELSREVASLHARQLLCTLCVALNFNNQDSSSEIQSKNKEISIRCINILLESLTEAEKEELKKDFQKTFSSSVKFCNFYKEILDIFQNKI